MRIAALALSTGVMLLSATAALAVEPMPVLELTRAQALQWFELRKTCGEPKGEECKNAFLSLLTRKQKQFLAKDASGAQPSNGVH